jgi:hypothetical protein
MRTAKDMGVMIENEHRADALGCSVYGTSESPNCVEFPAVI